MKKYRFPLLSVLGLALVLFPALRAEEPPPLPPTPATASTPEAALAQPAANKAVAVVADDKDEEAADEKARDAADAAKAELKEAEAQLAAAQERISTAKAKHATEVKAKIHRAGQKLRELGVGVDADGKPVRKLRSRAHASVDLGIAGTGHEIVVFNRDARVGKGETAETVVAIGGNAQVDGDSHDAVVTVLGNSEVNGKVGDAVVAVLGSTKINGHVGDAVVAVLGNVILGPDAIVEGEVVSIGGSITRDPKSTVKGSIQEVAFMDHFPELGGLKTWISKCAFWGRMLWFSPGLGWAWLLAAGFLVFYTLLALLFPGGIEKCAEVLEQRPGGTFLAMLLTVLLTPVLIVLLCITVVGIAVVPFLVIGLIFATLFGKAAVFGWIGRRLVKPADEGAATRTALAVFVGGLLVMLLYTIPILGLLLFKFFGLLGLAMVVYRLILSMQREKRKAAPVMPAAPAAAGLTPAGSALGAAEAEATVSPGAAPSAVAPPPVIFSSATLPRAGFWIRLAASLLDFLMVAITVNVVLNSHDGPGLMFFILAAYSAAMWKAKGTTIGGVICGLKVVRLDDRPLDWTIAIVRALTAFLSFFVAGLGFIWVVFDDEKQSWHDKIAGTTIVRVPKGTALL